MSVLILRIILLYDDTFGIYMAYEVRFRTQNMNMDALVVSLHVMPVNI